MDDSCIFSLKMFFLGSTSSILGKLNITIVVISVNQLTILNFLAHFLKTSKISIIFVWLNWELVYLLKTCWNCAVSSPMWPPDPDIKYDFKKSCHFLDPQIYTWYALMATDILRNILMFLHAHQSHKNMEERVNEYSLFLSGR